MGSTIPLSPQTIEALAFVISGGSAYRSTPPIGLYRTGPQLESFMRTCGVVMEIGSQSRVPTLVSALTEAAGYDDAETIKTIIERAADPRDFVEQPEKHAEVVSYLNKYLVYDGLELKHEGTIVRLVRAGTTGSPVTSLVEALRTFDFDTVHRDLNRALDSADSDPEDAITAACSTVESLCRSILIELGLPLPERKDLQGLYRAICEPLGLASRSDFPPEVASDIRTVLSGLVTTVQSIGALRTHTGDAHGRERGFGRVEPRLARLAIHSASSACLFILETWQQKFPTRRLLAR